MQEDNFKLFEKSAGCAGQGFSCLRLQNDTVIRNANDATIRTAPAGSFAFGPGADGEWVRQLPHLEMYTGNFFQGLESLVVTHTSNESSMFADSFIKTTEDLDKWQKRLLPSDPRIQDLVHRHFDTFRTVPDMLADLIQGAAFTCNVRTFTQNFPGRTYNMQYSQGKGTHGADILTTFYSKQNPITNLVAAINSDVPTVGRKLQAYLTSYVLTGNPNTLAPSLAGTAPPSLLSSLNPFRSPGLLAMTKPANHQAPMFTVLDLSTKEKYVNDYATSAEQCDFWNDGLAVVTNLLGYAAPGAVRQGSIEVYNPSEFYYAARTNVTNMG
jgi:hypothetical protein